MGIRLSARRAGPVLLPLLAALLAGGPAVATPVDQVAAAPAITTSIETDRRTRPVAPGLELTSFDRLDASGWIRADALTADLAGSGLSVGYLNTGAVARTAPLRGVADQAGAVAAVNGDFFDINQSGAAQGVGVRDGALVQSPVAGHPDGVAVGPDGVGRVVQFYFDGTATLPGGPVTLTQFNNLVQAGGIGVFTALWGDYDRARAVAGAARVTEVTLAGGRVAAVTGQAGKGPIPAGTTVLLGRDAGADALGGLRPGDAVEVTYRARPDDDRAVAAAIGGNRVLVRDGVPQDLGDVTPEPRTAVGFSTDGKKMIMLTVDGRQADSRGVTLTELGRLMASLGAHDALNLDGGGSSTLVAREPGAAAVRVENAPSDGSERPVPNGLAIYAPAGSGRLRAYWVETAIDPEAAPGIRPDRVFPGLTRRLTAAGYDETYGPAAGTPGWRATHGTVSKAGVFRALLPGRATVTATSGSARGDIDLVVLGPLSRVDATADKVALDGAGATGTFGVVGYDAESNSAPIEPADVRLDFDPALVDVVAGANGSFTVKAVAGSGAGLVTATVAGRSTVVPVSIGLTDVPVATFDDAAAWRFSAARATGSVAPAPGHTGGGLRMAYDFGQSTGTRAAYADPPQWIPVDGQPQAFGMWIYGNGKGEWPSLHLHDALDQQHVLRGPYVTWTGWRYVEMAVPPGVQYPVRIRRFYVAETDPAEAYQTDIVIDDLVARVAPPVDVPPEPPRTDRVVLRNGTVDGAPWRLAVLSDAQFVAADPDSTQVERARRTLREIRAAGPDLLVINGDLVDTAYPADFALAQQILDEELGGALPYYYVPGNHEVMGAPITNFTSVFGPTSRVVDHHGTRLVTLDSSAGSLSFDQVVALRAALDAAAVDPRVGSVAVFEHHPPRDPTPAKASELGDRKQAALVERWLADFQHRTGKGAAFVGAHVGTFHADRVDGVPYLVNGNSGKEPSTAPHLGGFTGWTMLGIDPVTPAEAARARLDPLVEGPRWIEAEVNPHVDAVTLAAPATVAVGTPAVVSASLTQPGGRLVPVAPPVTAQWSGSADMHVGSAIGIRPGDRAWFDPATGRLTALRADGSVTLAVTVNGVKAAATVELRRR
ncbi:Calcineurin-like phosphoesterase [Asanoa hainanensis]|uniref:Calcineurin-like phosphoesterase n=1 Tax=Asanoa hainanensis TaxID=560556 RepID=A0A239KCV8_9ACTN|nr:phosphodiester glycosidase family protein [Asanoa hainanensis]SNT15961.1 Calcineurin-like phosphoesterase [Asanoa hainanensis]